MTPPSTHVVERGEDPDLTWTTSQHGQVGILTLAGCLDDSSAARVRAHIETWVQERPGQEGAIVLDLRQVYDLTVSALAILISPSQPDRLDLRLVAAPHPAFTVLQAHHSTAPLPLFHTPEAALAPELTEVQRLRSELDQRREQLAGQPAIEQAKGILMHNFGLTPDEAFALLRRVSQDTNLKVRAIAEQLVGALTGYVTPRAAERVATVIEDLRQQARAAH